MSCGIVSLHILTIVWCEERTSGRFNGVKRQDLKVGGSDMNNIDTFSFNAGTACCSIFIPCLGDITFGLPNLYLRNIDASSGYSTLKDHSAPTMAVESSSGAPNLGIWIRRCDGVITLFDIQLALSDGVRVQIGWSNPFKLLLTMLQCMFAIVTIL